MSKFNILNSLKRNLAMHEGGAESQNETGEEKYSHDDLETYRNINNEKYEDDNVYELAHMSDSMINTIKHENTDITMINVEEAHFYPDTDTQDSNEGAVYFGDDTTIVVSGPNASEGIEKILEAEEKKKEKEFIIETIEDAIQWGGKIAKKRKRKKNIKKFKKGTRKIWKKVFK